MKSYDRFRRDIIGLNSKILEYEADEGNDVQDVVVTIPGILSYQLYCFIVNFIYDYKQI